ncbi:MAG: hypothetical protein AB8F95_10365 [Bacteroidia bacterium]
MNRIVLILVAVALLAVSCSQQLGEERSIRGTVKSAATGAVLQDMYLTFLHSNGKNFPNERIVALDQLTEATGEYFFTFEPFKIKSATDVRIAANAAVQNEYAGGFFFFRLPLGTITVPLQTVVDQPSDEPLENQDILVSPFGRLILELDLPFPASPAFQASIRISNDNFTHSIDLQDQDLRRRFEFPVPLDERFNIDVIGTASGTPVSASDTLRVQSSNTSREFTSKLEE